MNYILYRKITLTNIGMVSSVNFKTARASNYFQETLLYLLDGKIMLMHLNRVSLVSLKRLELLIASGDTTLFAVQKNDIGAHQ